MDELQIAVAIAQMGNSRARQFSARLFTIFHGNITQTARLDSHVPEVGATEQIEDNHLLAKMVADRVANGFLAYSQDMENVLNILHTTPGIGGMAIKEACSLSQHRWVHICQRLHKVGKIRKEGSTRNAIWFAT
jgi:hypothetical protein